jgi:hypothetical protein
LREEASDARILARRRFTADERRATRGMVEEVLGGVVGSLL